MKNNERTQVNNAADARRRKNKFIFLLVNKKSVNLAIDCSKIERLTRFCQDNNPIIR